MGTGKTPGPISDEQRDHLVETIRGLREGYTRDELRDRVAEVMNAYRLDPIIERLDAPLVRTEKELRSLASASGRMLKIIDVPGVRNALVAEANEEGKKRGGWPDFPPDLILRPGEPHGKDFHGTEKVRDLAEKVRNLGKEVSKVMEEVGALRQDVQTLHDLAEGAASRYADVAASRDRDPRPRGPRRTRREIFKALRAIYEDATGRRFTVDKRERKAPSGPGIDFIQACFDLVERRPVPPNTIDGWHRDTPPH